MDQAVVSSYFERNLDRYLEFLKEMVGQNSFTANPPGINALGELTFSKFKGLGFVMERVSSVVEEYGDHFIFTRKGTGKGKIGLVSHLDTVFPEDEEMANDFHWRRSKNKIFGPGTVDIKGGTMVILMLLEALQKFSPESFESVTWKVMLNAAEERLSEDFGVIARETLVDADACLVFEGGFYSHDSDKFRLVASRKGMAHFHVRVDGLSAHAGVSHEKGANAIRELSQVVEKIESFTDYEEHLTYNVGLIRGGVVTNRIPHFAEAFIEMRAFDSGIFERGIEQVMALAGEGTIKNDNGYSCQVHVDLSDITSPWPSNEGTDRLLGLWQQTGADLGFEIIPERRGGLSDGNQTWQVVPTLDALGPGGGGAHQSEHDPERGKTQEYIYIPSIIPKALLNTFALERLIETL